ncbi:hypothetical protein BOTCAL_0676g00010 [Botryotinia calthae]|uniref:Uncharacterized protein n=1 Tax=Botryotinia calthae TaxID=38488 RepID=A0A4Y8CHH3_9HELO|nr:hypothetical protein BOTCAL_0676g00010 [Botryotinia calthae]
MIIVGVIVRTVITAEGYFSSFSPSVSSGGDLESTDYDDGDLPGFGSDSGDAKPASTRSSPRKEVDQEVRSKPRVWIDNDRGDQNTKINKKTDYKDSKGRDKVPFEVVDLESSVNNGDYDGELKYEIRLVQLEHGLRKKKRALDALGRRK